MGLAYPSVDAVTHATLPASLAIEFDLFNLKFQYDKDLLYDVLCHH